jgi:hypothetical protein
MGLTPAGLVYNLLIHKLYYAPMNKQKLNICQSPDCSVAPLNNSPPAHRLSHTSRQMNHTVVQLHRLRTKQMFRHSTLLPYAIRRPQFFLAQCSRAARMIRLTILYSQEKQRETYYIQYLAKKYLIFLMDICQRNSPNSN